MLGHQVAIGQNQTYTIISIRRSRQTQGMFKHLIHASHLVFTPPLPPSTKKRGGNVRSERQQTKCRVIIRKKNFLGLSKTYQRVQSEGTEGDPRNPLLTILNIQLSRSSILEYFEMTSLAKINYMILETHACLFKRVRLKDLGLS